MIFCIWEDVAFRSPEQQKKSSKMTFGAYVELPRTLMSLLDLRTCKGMRISEAEEERTALSCLRILCFVLVTF